MYCRQDLSWKIKLRAPGGEEKKDSISDEESHLTFLQQHSFKGERKCQHLPPTEGQNTIVDDPKLADTAARPCEVNASLGKGAGRSRGQRGRPGGLAPGGARKAHGSPAANGRPAPPSSAPSPVSSGSSACTGTPAPATEPGTRSSSGERL